MVNQQTVETILLLYVTENNLAFPCECSCQMEEEPSAGCNRECDLIYENDARNRGNYADFMNGEMVLFS
jgi:hypothetical protein